MLLLLFVGSGGEAPPPTPPLPIDTFVPGGVGQYRLKSLPRPQIIIEVPSAYRHSMSGALGLSGQFPSFVHHAQEFRWETAGELSLAGSFSSTLVRNPRQFKHASKGGLGMRGTAPSSSWSFTKWVIAVDDAMLMGEDLVDAEERISVDFARDLNNNSGGGKARDCDPCGKQ